MIPVVYKKVERNTDTFKFFPTHVDMPKTSAEEATATIAQNITHELQHPNPAAPLEHVGNMQQSALKKLAEIFQT